MQHAVGSSSSLAGRLAAQYVRMSTDYQEYSTENQKLPIADFAEKQGITVVATYEDAGKSGVKGRPALLDLLQDVQSRANKFSLVLVYDVSRWDRFQDVDECAHYEYLCKEAGVQVVYCAEQFAGDGSASAALMKTIKRTMAGEYSRELSHKVFVGQCRLAEQGFWQGAAPGYGLQRLLLASDGTVKGRLCDKERKNIQSDRVVVVPGDKREVSLVRRIYDWYVIQGLGCKRIADRLNAFGLCNDHGRPWNPQQIKSILSNEKYVGTNVYGRTSRKLGGNWHRNLPADWSRANGAFPALVDQAKFRAAEAIRINRTHNLSDDEILRRLRDFVRSSEVVSAKAIDDASGTPGGKTYWRRFGCMKLAYERVGFERDYVGAGREVYRASRAALQGCVERTTSALKALGHVIEISRDETTIRVDNELVVRFAICIIVQFDAHCPRWRMRWPTYCSPDLLVVLRQDSAFVLPLDFYVFPRGSLTPGDVFSLSVRVGSSCPFETFRYPDESVLLKLTERTRLEALNVR